jgi:nitrate reductase alpha subunit
MRHVISITAVTLLLFLTACTSSNINSNRINESAFPPDFKCNECVLLVMKRVGGMNPGGMNNYIEKSFTKNYTGKFEMATSDQIENDPKYQNTKIYRFIVSDQVRTGGSKVTTSTISNGITTGKDIQYNYTYTMDFRIYDRLMNKEYPSMGLASNVPAKAINRTSVLLNKKLTQ